MPINSSLVNNKDIDVFGLTETWHNDAEDVALRRIVPTGFQCIDAARPARSTTHGYGGGVALIYRDSLSAKQLKFDFNPTTFEYVSSVLSTSNARFLFIIIYRPGSEPVLH